MEKALLLVSEQKTMKYTKHIFICVNERSDGRKSCGATHGMDLVTEFKKQLKDKFLHVRIRAQKAGCLDVCSQGPALVIYPEGAFYGNVQVADVQEIVNEHIQHNRPVQRLLMKFGEGNG